MSTRWLVKRVDDVFRGAEQRDVRGPLGQPAMRRRRDSHDFGWVPAADSYRVVWTVRGAASDRN